MTHPTPTLADLGHQTHSAAQHLARLSADDRNQALEAMAQALEAAAGAIVAANQADCAAAAIEGIAPALAARLTLGESKLRSAIAGVRDVARLADPLGTVQLARELDDGLVLKRLTCPLGVLGVIFEARPDAVIQIAALAVKSGNGAILKGGKEAVRSCQAIMDALRKGLSQSAVPPAALQLLTTREETRGLLQLDRYVDLIIPRGSNEFVQFVQNNTRIPVLGHADGICHLYVDRGADLPKAIAIAVDAKTHYPAACNAIETLLIHSAIAPSHLPPLAAALQDKGVVLKGDDRSRQILPSLTAATPEDWATEYSDLVLSVAVVDSLAEALAHIDRYGSGHTDAIVTEDEATAAQFLAQVDSAGVYHNCSTRFADGFRYGFGAEVGISTHKLPPRGPVGLEGLVTYKYQVVGQGHIAATYSGDRPKPFTHRDLPQDC
ncbi:glutamate-5-semialdehyde dehydrogenase [Prochlorothrix hollandica]|uniref:Gamma-glutamyl phosphate reductase n=1 Tax=Prochlorothrix hollandica PCC 9006 = CALU 1027 TaxID=317619 RepID=A0A0M2PYN2_PROHO|nr:glutamate-5-semialdehyde dehydrogenase [Prochlorothrix hollandica]KKI99491.1 gamma-glutamyl phosphate reductase [Prochlorothrix hollandica PCC 9006 = CALU 1027]